MNADSFSSGEFLPGTKYRIVRPLGEGAMGVVWQCLKEPGIRCVVKVMRRHLARDLDQRRRFLAEVRVLAELRHPNIVRVLDYDTLADGTPFFAMELLTGKTLETVLRERGALPPRVAYAIVSQLLAALQAAHTHATPIVHRDVKPANIFIDVPPDGEPQVKLLDFGVATIALRETVMAGTYGYMSPEQLRSAPVTAQTDVYAAAAVLFEMLVGEGPFDVFAQGGAEAVARATLSAPAPRMSRYVKWIPATVDDAVADALEKDPERRPKSAHDFRERLVELDRDDLPYVEPRSSSAKPNSAFLTEPSLRTLFQFDIDRGGTDHVSQHHQRTLAPLSTRAAPRPPEMLEDPGVARRRKVLTVSFIMACGIGLAALVIGIVRRPPPPHTVNVSVTPAAMPTAASSEVANPKPTEVSSPPSVMPSLTSQPAPTRRGPPARPSVQVGAASASATPAVRRTDDGSRPGRPFEPGAGE